MSETMMNRVAAARIVPVIQLDKAADVLPLCEALRAGGLLVAEVTFRTAAAREAIALAAEAFPEFALGAGTVTTVEEVRAAKEAGAQFALAPGCNPTVISAARACGLPFWPGVCTPSDVERGLELGCTVQKFFPAAAAGGPAMLKAMFGPYKHRGLRFVPTGGIGAGNLLDWLRLPGVVACGGSWLVEPKLISAGDWTAIEDLTREAVEMVASLG
jgi:2-dehydro-3-deoxyphosphogluconate aldolase/(4S)-4-hydroxy-2-oxoglutarate aldolase